MPATKTYAKRALLAVGCAHARDRQREPRRKIRLQLLLRRLRPKAFEVGREVAVKEGERVLGVGVGVEALGEKHVRAEAHLAPCPHTPPCE